MSYDDAIRSNNQMTYSYIKKTHSYIKMKHSYIKMIHSSWTFLSPPPPPPPRWLRLVWFCCCWFIVYCNSHYGSCICSMFCCTLLYIHSNFAILLMGKRELVAFLSFSSWCLLIVVWHFLVVQWICLQFVLWLWYSLNIFTHYFTYEPVHEISNNVLCATSKASDQPAHTRSLIRAFASRLSILWLLSYWLNIIWSF